MAALPPALSVAEAAVALGVNPRTVYNMIETGQCPSVKLGQRVIKVPTSKFIATYELDRSDVVEKLDEYAAKKTEQAERKGSAA